MIHVEVYDVIPGHEKDEREHIVPNATGFTEHLSRDAENFYALIEAANAVGRRLRLKARAEVK